MRAHSAFGRNAGLTTEQIRALRRLDLDKFEPREYAALNWVRHFLTCRDGVPPEVEEAFAGAFTPKEVLYIKTSLKGMFCVNLFLSTVLRGEMGSRVASWLEKSLGDAKLRKERILRGKPGPDAAVPSDGFPEEVRYHREHMWAREDGTIGLTFYAQDQLGEIVLVEFRETGTEVRTGEICGTVESIKSESELYSPVSGVIAEVNAAVLEAPELINGDPYGAGWIARVELCQGDGLASLLCNREYRDLVCGTDGV
jgi:glycine cleavage system H protein